MSRKYCVPCRAREEEERVVRAALAQARAEGRPYVLWDDEREVDPWKALRPGVRKGVLLVMEDLHLGGGGRMDDVPRKDYARIDGANLVALMRACCELLLPGALRRARPQHASNPGQSWQHMVAVADAFCDAVEGRKEADAKARIADMQQVLRALAHS